MSNVTPSREGAAEGHPPIAAGQAPRTVESSAFDGIPRVGATAAARRGKVHFAGEHTSQDFQGYLNGGVETGDRAAAEILQDYKAGVFP